MQCPSCGYSIEQQNLDRCPRCGRLFAAQSESPAPSHPPQPQQSSPYPQQSPQFGYGAPPPSSAPPAGYPQPYGQGSPPNYPPGYYQPAYPPSTYFQPTLAPVPPRKNPTGLIVGIVALVVVVLAVCTGGTIFAVRSLGNLKSIRSLRTVTVASPSPAPTATATPVRTVIYQNSLASNADGWSNDASNCFWKSDGYHVTNNYECYAPTGAQTSVDVSVRAQQVSGDPTTPYGIVFGLDDKNNDYEFMIVSDSAWALFRCVAASCAKAVDYTDNNAILGGLRTSNRLEVLVQETHFEFYVNGAKVGSFDDPNYTSGRLGVTVGDAMDAVFTDFVVSRP